MDYDAELRLHNQFLRRAYGIQRHNHVLDIGCGTGQTTREAGRMAAAGTAVGVDVSARMIERARELTRAEGLRNVTFEHADVQVHRFPSERFDVAISRFGTMFFRDPVVAFANVGRALRPAGRLVMMVWQGHERNEWSVSIERALESAEEVPGRASEEPDPFSLADPAIVEGILGAAGFAEVTFTDVNQPVYYGRDVVVAALGSAASRARGPCSSDWIPPLRGNRWGACARPSRRMRAKTAFGSTRGPGS
jgi:SAM-dependent methyltransferase